MPHETLSPAKERPAAGRRWAAPLLAGVLGLLLTSLGVAILERSYRAHDRVRFERMCERTNTEISRRMGRFASGLRGAMSLWPASKTVERAEFTAMVRSRDLPVEFPGSIGLGFVRRVPLADLDAFVSRTRADEAPDFTVRSSGPARDLFVIEFIEPLAENAGAPGRDLGAEPACRDAALHAMRTGGLAITAPLTLAQAANEGPGFFMFLPVYTTEKPPRTVAEREASLVGWTYMPVVARRVMLGIELESDRQLDVVIHDGAAPQRLIYDEIAADPDLAGAPPGSPPGPRRHPPPGPPTFEDRRELQVAGQTWIVTTRSTPTFRYVSRVSVFAMALGGALVSVMGAGLIWTLGRTAWEARRIARTMTADLIRSKGDADRLAMVARKTTNAVIMTDAEGRITWINEGFTRMAGYTEREAVGRTPASLVQSRNADQEIRRQMRASLAAGEAFKGEILNRGKSGREYWVDLDIQPIRDDAGALAGFIAIESEITDKVVTRDRMKSIFTAVAEGILLQDAAGRIIECNAAAERILGVRRDELKGRYAFDPRWSSVREDGTSLPGDEHPAMVTLRTGEAQRSRVIGIRTPGGILRWILMSTEPVRDSDGTTVAVVASFADITAQRDQHRRLDLIVSAAGLGTWDWWIADGRVASNRYRATMLGYEPEEIEPRISAWENLVHPDDRASMLAALEAHVEGRTAEYRCEQRLLRKDGTWAWILDVGRVTERDGYGRPIRASGIHLDISESKALEQSLSEAKQAAEAANHSKSEFLANMSHEIRTPMTAILGYADLLLDEQESVSPIPRRDAIQTIRRNGEHLLAIINDILDLSKIEAGKMSVEATPMSPTGVMREVLTLMQVKSAAKGLSMGMTWETWAPTEVLGDPLRLRQILVNLVGNAIKFTAKGSVSISAAYLPSDGKGQLRIRVADTGIGLREDEIGRLFGAFAQADSSTTRKYGGTGLGLRISKRLARMLGGDITVTSEPGVGSAFTVTLMVEESERTHAEPREESPAGDARVEPAMTVETGPAALAGLRVLLAEDGPDNVRLLIHHLKKAGATVTCVENGRLAIESLTTDGTVGGPLADPPPFDLLLTDMQMPEIDGYTACRMLRGKGSRLPIVALTAHTMTEDVARCLDAGCDEFAAKPIDRVTLIARCLSAVKRARETLERRRGA